MTYFALPNPRSTLDAFENLPLEQFLSCCSVSIPCVLAYAYMETDMKCGMCVSIYI